MIKYFFRFILKIFFWLFTISITIVFVYKWIPVYVTPLMVIRHMENVDKTIWEHEWIPIENISKNLQLAVICSEDQSFLNHSGFDFKAIKKAIESNRKGKKLRGASTISQQTAKNVFLWQKRSWIRKGLESYFTFLMEVIWSKKRIMEVYLNSIEMGSGIYGAEAASQYWFKKQASQLTPNEAAAIASILPNPRVYRANPASAYIQKRKNWIVNQMRNFGKLDYKINDERKFKD